MPAESHKLTTIKAGGTDEADDAAADPRASPGTERRKTLIHAAYPLWRKHLLVTLARAKQLTERGDDVVVTYCNATRGTCAVNYSGSPVACAICRSRVRETVEAAGIRTVPLDAHYQDAPEDSLTLTELRATVEGVHSGMITAFRTMKQDSKRNRLLSGVKQRYFRHARGLLVALRSVLRREAPEAVEVFNGRHACSRFALTAANTIGVPFNTIEVTASQKPIVFSGHLVHDRRSIQQRILQNEANMELAEQFYANRRKPRANKFAKKHANEFTPPNADRFRRKITVFLSSQDEFESLGKDWESPFLDYAPIVRRACEQHPEDLFCIRFHPNQASMVGDVAAPFRELEQLSNVVIYYPEDTANTYTLVDWSDLVITFGSTVSIEACWVGKPVILLGPSFYDSLDIAHTPDTVEAFLELLPQDLQPGNRANAARFATYELTDHDPITHVDRQRGKMVARGVTLKHPWLAQLARTSDDVYCHALKFWASRTKHSDTITQKKAA